MHFQTSLSPVDLPASAGTSTRTTTMNESLSQLSRSALKDLGEVFARMPDSAADALIGAIVKARRIVVYGCGREGLQMRGFAMRLFHLGRNVSVWGDMTMPAVGAGDLLFVSAGPGYLATAEALVAKAREAGATTALITAQAHGELASQVDAVIVLPAQTMADDLGAARSALPMGSLFEAAQMLFFEFVILKLRPLLGETVESMRARHTNLE
jgi:6-phospho-3-hexuloisomerase